MATIVLDSLAVLGPTFALKSVLSPKQLGRKMVAEMWFYPDSSRLLELMSAKKPLKVV